MITTCILTTDDEVRKITNNFKDRNERWCVISFSRPKDKHNVLAVINGQISTKYLVGTNRRHILGVSELEQKSGRCRQAENRNRERNRPEAFKKERTGRIELKIRDHEENHWYMYTILTKSNDTIVYIKIEKDIDLIKYEGQQISMKKILVNEKIPVRLTHYYPRSDAHTRYHRSQKTYTPLIWLLPTRKLDKKSNEKKRKSNQAKADTR